MGMYGCTKSPNAIHPAGINCPSRTNPTLSAITNIKSKINRVLSSCTIPKTPTNVSGCSTQLHITRGPRSSFFFGVACRSTLGGWRTGWRRISSSTICGVSVWRRLQLNPGLLLLRRWPLLTEVAVLLWVGRVLWWWLSRVVRVTVERLAGGRRTGWWCHPCCSSVWAEAVSAAAAGVEASASEWSVELNIDDDSVYSREAEEK